MKLFFPHIIVDFDLPMAMKQGLVKLLLLDRRQELTNLENLDYNAERDEQGKIVGLSEGQRMMLRAGFKFSYIGFKTKTKVLRRPRGKQTLQVVLREASTTLDEVNIKGEKIQSDQIQELKTKDMKMTPSANGNGVESLIQQQAGVSTHNELSSQYNVRGGAFDENSVYINNVEVFRPFLVRSGQQEGLSVIDRKSVV